MNRDLPSEARRYDGGPAPKRNAGVGIGDAKAAAEEARRNATCDHCDHDDYEDLKMVQSSYQHGCSAHQHPDPDPLRLCPDCREDHNPEEDFISEKRESETVYALYECGIVLSASEPDVEGYGHREPPSVPVECRCGAEIEEVLY